MLCFHHCAGNQERYLIGVPRNAFPEVMLKNIFNLCEVVKRCIDANKSATLLL